MHLTVAGLFVPGTKNRTPITLVAIGVNSFSGLNVAKMSSYCPLMFANRRPCSSACRLLRRPGICGCLTRTPLQQGTQCRRRRPRTCTSSGPAARQAARPIDFPTAGGGRRVAGVVGLPEQTAERGHGGREPGGVAGRTSILVNANADGPADAGEPSGSTIAEAAAASTDTAPRDAASSGTRTWQSLSVQRFQEKCSDAIAPCPLRGVPVDGYDPVTAERVGHLHGVRDAVRIAQDQRNGSHSRARTIRARGACRTAVGCRAVAELVCR